MTSKTSSGGQSAGGWLGTHGAMFQGPTPPPGKPRLAKFGSMQVQFPHSTMFTASFEVQTNVTLGGLPLAIAAIAVVEWAVEGVPLRRVIDVVGGQSISGVAQAVMLKMFDNSPAGTPAGIPYLVSALAAPYPRPGGSLPPTYSPKPSSPVPPGGSVSVSVPQSVGVRSVQVTAASLVFGVTPNVLAHAQLQPYAPAPPLPPPIDLDVWPVAGITPFLPLPPGVQSIVVENLNPTHPVTVGVTFGIDG